MVPASSLMKTPFGVLHINAAMSLRCMCFCFFNFVKVCIIEYCIVYKLLFYGPDRA